MNRPAVIDALKELDPGQRALLDLSLNRELSDSMIAGLLENIDESGVAGMRAEALTTLAQAAGVEGPEASQVVERELKRASDRHWLGVGDTNGNGNGSAPEARPARTEPQPGPPPPPVRREPPPDSYSARGSRGLWLGLLLIVAGIVGIVIAVAGGGDSSDEASTAGAEPVPQVQPGPAPGPDGGATGEDRPPPAPEPEPEGIVLRPLPGTGLGAARVAITPAGEGRYEVRLRGLSDAGGYYRLWLYDSLIESLPVAGAAGGDASFSFELPSGAESYGSLDLSRESARGDRIHSGQSLFRVPLERLSG